MNDRCLWRSRRGRRRLFRLGDRLGLGLCFRHHLVMGRCKALQREAQGITLAIVGHDVDLAGGTGLSESLHQGIVDRHLDIAAPAVAAAILEHRRGVVVGLDRQAFWNGHFTRAWLTISSWAAENPLSEILMP